MEAAIHRETQIKKGSRKHKLMLIERMNHEWKDLYEEILTGWPRNFIARHDGI